MQSDAPQRPPAATGQMPTALALVLHPRPSREGCVLAPSTFAWRFSILNLLNLTTVSFRATIRFTILGGELAVPCTRNPLQRG